MAGMAAQDDVTCAEVLNLAASRYQAGRYKEATALCEAVYKSAGGQPAKGSRFSATPRMARMVAEARGGDALLNHEGGGALANHAGNPTVDTARASRVGKAHVEASTARSLQETSRSLRSCRSESSVLEGAAGAPSFRQTARGREIFNSSRLSSVPMTPTIEAPSYQPSSSRWQTEGGGNFGVSSELTRARAAAVPVQSTARRRRTEEARNMVLARQEADSHKQKLDSARFAQLRSDPHNSKARVNRESVPMDFITHTYKENADGQEMRRCDEQRKDRAEQRSEFLRKVGRNNGLSSYNIITTT